MILNLKKDIHLRAIIFENIAKVLLRRKLNNNFIFMTKYFTSLEEIITKYRLNMVHFEKDFIDFLNKNFHSLDLIGFVLDNKHKRLVNDLLFYEVKTKSSFNNSNYDMCVSSFELYDFLKRKNFSIFLVSFVIFEDWEYSFNIHNLDLNKIRVYSRF